MDDEGVRGVQPGARAHFQHPGQFLHLPHCSVLELPSWVVDSLTLF